MKQRISDSPSWTNLPIIFSSERYLFIVVIFFYGGYFLIEYKELLILFFFNLQGNSYLLLDILINIKCFLYVFMETEIILIFFFLSRFGANINSCLWLTFHVYCLFLKEEIIEENTQIKIKCKLIFFIVHADCSSKPQIG